MINNSKLLSIGIIGRPNAGKSSLLNRLINQKLSIVTPKVQTTRSIITGVITIDQTQLIFFDTPGIFEPKKSLEKAMVRCAWSSLYGADMVMLIIDSTTSLDDNMCQILDRLNSQKIKPIFILNKIDLVSNKHKSLENDLLEQFSDAQIFKISTLSGKGINGLLTYLISKATSSPWDYEQDDMTNLPMRFLAAEITREQLFLNLQDELPYHLTVQTEKWQDNPDNSITINQVIVVSKDSYKMIILGKNGAKIKEIGTKARIEIGNFLSCKVHLLLFVKVRDWENSKEYYDYMGLKLEKDYVKTSTNKTK